MLILSKCGRLNPRTGPIIEGTNCAEIDKRRLVNYVHTRAAVDPIRSSSAAPRCFRFRLTIADIPLSLRRTLAGDHERRPV